MINEKYSCTSEFGAEVLMVIISFIIVYNVLYLFQIEMGNIGNTPLSDQSANLFLSSAHALFLPLMSYLFSQAKQYSPEGKSQVILIWMVLVEIIRIRGGLMSTWGLQKLFEELVRLLWVGFLVYNYTPLHGIRTSLFVLCVYFAICVILKGIIVNKAKESYLIGKNPKLIHNYIKRVMSEDHLHTTPMSNCDYIVMGEENIKITVCDNGYLLGEKKPKSVGVLTIGRVFQLESLEDEAFTTKHPYWRDCCLSLALAKMLRRRFAKLTLDEVECEKALNFVLEGLIKYIGRVQDIQTNRSNEERNPTERLFIIIHEELKLVSDFLHIKVPIYHYFGWYIFVDAIGVSVVFYTGIYLIVRISQKSSAWLSVVARDAYNHCFFHILRRGSVVVKVFSVLDLVITILLFVACLYIQYIGSTSARMSKRWNSLSFIKRYIEDPDKWKKSHSSPKTSTSSKILPSFADIIEWLMAREQSRNVKKTCASILDLKAETIFFCIKVDWSILVSLPKWIRRKIPRSIRTVFHSTNTKEAILSSLRNSKGRLTNGETSLRSNKMEHLNRWLNGSITEVILVWHIATTLYHHQEFLSKQNTNPHQEPSVQENTDLLKKQEVALELSRYFHYLVAYFPELLPDEVEWIGDMYERVIKDILAIELSCDKKPTKINHCNALHDKWGESPPVEGRTSSMLEKGTKLAKDLMKSAADGAPVWTILADFWVEMMLFVAPSDNVEAHEKVLYRGELITQLWALLTHAGILTGPKPTEHCYHESTSNEINGDMNV